MDYIFFAVLFVIALNSFFLFLIFLTLETIKGVLRQYITHTFKEDDLKTIKNLLKDSLKRSSNDDSDDV